MIKKFSFKGAHWIDLYKPTQEEISDVVKEFKIDPIVAHEMTSPSIKHRVELRKHFIYLILQFPAFKQSNSNDESQEMDFIVGKDFVITTHYENIEFLERFSKSFEVETILNKKFNGNARDLIFFGILGEFSRSIGHQLSYIEDWLEDIESRIFSGKERDMVFSLSEVGRHLLDFKKITSPYHEIFKSLEIAGVEIFGDDFGFYVRGLMEEFNKVDHVIKSDSDFVTELRSTNNSLLSTKQNEVMRIFTVMALFTFPLTLVAGIFSMKSDHTPIVGNSYDFWIIITIMLLISSIMYTFFKHKKWL